MYVAVLSFLILSVIIIFGFEYCFRIAYFLKNKKVYKPLDFKIVNSFAYTPHPYIPYLYKKKFFIKRQRLRGQSQGRKNMSLFGVKTNSLGFVNGPNGDREIINPNPRILIELVV